MAKPRVFISSTYYDLKQTRENLGQFLTSLGYDPVRNEKGDIPYGNRDALETYCYKEVDNIDIFVSIIGGRYGSESKVGEWSVSNQELRTAISKGKQVYIFIDKSVDNEYGTYLLNKGNADTKYKYVDNVKIYQFLEEIHSLTTNNNIKTFESSSEIQDFLKEQFAGLFQSFLESSSKAKDVNLTNKLETLAERFEQLTQKIEGTNDAVNKTISTNQYITHPVVQRIASFMAIRYGIWFDDYAKLNALFEAYRWKKDDNEDAYRWTHETSIAGSINVISVNKSLFDENGKLLPFDGIVAYDDAVRLVSEGTPQVQDDDLPF